MKLHRINPKSLTATAIAARGPNSRWNDGGGLALLCNVKGNADQNSWLFRGTLTHEGADCGKVFELRIGTLDEVTLATAREQAEAIRAKLGSKIDPRAPKKVDTKHQLVRFEQFADALINREAAGRSAEVTECWRGMFAKHFAEFMPRNITTIGRLELQTFFDNFDGGSSV